MKLLVKDAARLLDVPERTIYRWIGTGTIPAYRLGEQYRFNRAELIGWAAAENRALAPEIFREEDAQAAGLPRVTEALRAGGIHDRIGGSDAADVLAAVLAVLRLPREVDRGHLYEMLLPRERLGSTAIGGGIAIPNVRHPVTLPLERPLLALCFLEHPVGLGARDGKPVHALFTLAAATVRAHLHLLSRLSFILCDPAFRQAVIRHDTPDNLIAAAERRERGLDPAASAAP